MNSNKRMATNTVILYAKLIITIAVNLYSTRLILNAMGVKDYGIVSLISGIVAMLSFVQNSMTVSSQRYMSVVMGVHDYNEQKKVFNSSFVLHALLAIVIFVVLQSVIPLIFNSSIHIPADRIPAAQVLYQLTIIGTVLVILTVPFDASLNAHENMLIYSIASIIESMIRLLGSIILLGYGKDKLIFYGILLVTIRLVSGLIKTIYCYRHYADSHIRLKFADKGLIAKMFSFAFWNMFGALAMTGRSQGVAIVMNPFCGVTINASYGIANQLTGQLQNFTATISKAMNPQIMQRGGKGDNMGMIDLSLKQCRYASMLLAYAVIPMLFSMPFILKVWLKQVPGYCIEFCSLILIVSLFQQATSGIMSLIQATGRIRNYQVVVSFIILLNIPLSYLLLKLGLTPPVVIVSMIVIEVITCCVRLLFAKKLTGLRLISYIKEVVSPLVFIYGISCIALYTIQKNVDVYIDSMRTFIVFLFMSVIVVTISSVVALNDKERKIILSIIKLCVKKVQIRISRK